MNTKKIIIAGGTGFLGEVLSGYFVPPVYEVVILSRNPKLYSSHSRHVKWDGKQTGAWVSELENAYAVINLSGRSVDCRYTEKNKREILDSRVNSTRVIGTAIQQCAHPPKVWINAASATIYRHSMVRDMNEDGETGDDFSMNVCKEWEKAFWEMKTPATRKIVTRTSLVLGNYNNSVLPVLQRLVRFGLGGKMGSGKQSFSWIHSRDYARAIDFLLHRNDQHGVFNITAPIILSNREFMRLLRKEMKMAFGLGATKWMLTIGAFLIGTETELILKSRRALPVRLLDAGFKFHFPNSASALHDLIHSK